MASTYQASKGMPSGKNCGSGWDCQRSIAAHAESHTAAMTRVARVELPAGADLTRRSVHRRANAVSHACGGSSL
jgi:hypothetical protein